MRDYRLNDDDAAVLARFTKLCRDEIAPRAKETERAGVFPAQNYARLVESGYLGMGHDEAFGGSGVPSPALSVLMQERLGAACASTYLATGASCGLFGLPISFFGSAAQKDRYLRPLLAGKLIGAFGLTEPHAGSDVQAMKTTAVKDGAGYRLNGEKLWITNAPCCDAAVVFAKTDPSANWQGVSLFIVDKGMKGFSQGPPLDKLGFRGSPTGSLLFQDCYVEETRRVGDEGMGFIMAMQTLEYGRIGIAALSIGIAAAALDVGTRYVKERTAFGKPLSKFQDVAFKLSDIATDIELARTLTIRAAEDKQKDGEARTLASMAKLFASEMCVRATDTVMQVMGANGYSEEFPVARLARDARLCPIGEGASAIQRMLIARDLFGE